MTIDTAGSVRYEVEFVPIWNPATNPVEYPITHGKHGLLTPAIGATHGANYRIFTPGTLPTVGLEMLSERGKQTPLDSEIEAAIDEGNAGSVVRFTDGSPGPVHGSIKTTFEATASSPLVSIVGMIAPSPDWFYGVSSVRLLQGKRWVRSIVVEAYAWDSGGDGGSTYMAEDDDLNPKQATRQAMTSHFAPGGRAGPVGYFVFKQIPPAQKLRGYGRGSRISSDRG
jgi:hypothetical protein